MDFEAPERLHGLWIALAILVAAFAFARRRRARGVAFTSFVLRSAAVAGAVAIFAAPFRDASTFERARVDLVVDGSRSVGDLARSTAYRRAAAWAESSGVDVRVLTFGGGVAVRDPKTPDAPSSRPSFDSDPREALSAAALAPSRGGARLFFATDGRLPPPDEALVAHFRDRRAVVVRAGPDLPRGARLENVVGVPSGGEGVEPTVVVRGSSDVAAKATVEVRVDGALAKSYPLTLTSGAFEERFALGAVAPGRRLVAVSIRTEDALDAEPLDDEVGCVIDVPSPPVILVAAPEGKSVVASALRAQGLEPRVVDVDALAASLTWIEASDVVILDRANVERLSDAPIVAALDRFVRRGGGLLYLPPDPEAARGALVPAEGRTFLNLLPLVGREEPPPKPPEPPPPDPAAPPVEGLKPPDPNKKETERRDAPSLGLLLLIDASGSMKGQKLRLAQVAAAKAAEVLHPKDHVGVVAFNDGVTEVVPLGPAEDLAFVRSQISRIRAGGNTDFRAALDAARDVFHGAPLRIKHCILLSDGFSTTVGAFSKLARELREGGVTVSTVGVGVECDILTLSNIAAEGGGKYQGAPDEREVPQLFVVEAERLIKSSGARRRSDPPTSEPPKDAEPAPPRDDRPAPPHQPEPDATAPRKATPVLAAWPAAYLKGVKPETSGGVFDRHRTEATRGAWTALKTEAGDPILAHHYIGFGKVAAFAVPLEGPSVGPFLGWRELAPCLAQLVRFLLPGAPPERFDVQVATEGRDVVVSIDEADGTVDAADRVRVDARDQRGRALAVFWRRVDGRTLRASIPDDDPARCVDVVVMPRDVSATGSGRGAAALPLPREIADVGVSEDGLATWASAFGGEVVSAWPDAPDPPRVASRGREPFFPSWAPWLLALLLADLALKRAAAGVVGVDRRKEIA